MREVSSLILLLDADDADMDLTDPFILPLERMAISSGCGLDRTKQSQQVSVHIMVSPPNAIKLYGQPYVCETRPVTADAKTAPKLPPTLMRPNPNDRSSTLIQLAFMLKTAGKTTPCNNPNSTRDAVSRGTECVIHGVIRVRKPDAVNPIATITLPPNISASRPDGTCNMMYP